MPVPNHQCPHDVVAIDSPISRKPSPVPEVTRSTGAGALDIDQLAAVLARLLGV
jgi:hypothetical protein